VERPRHHLLARPGVADDQRIRIRRPDGADPVTQVDHDLGPARQPRLQIVALAGNGAQPAVLEHQSPAIEGTADHPRQVLRREWLLQEIIGAFAHCLDGQLYISVPGHEDDRDLGIQLADAMQERHAVDPRHADVGDHDAVEAEADQFQHRVGGGKCLHRQSEQLERLRRRPAQFLFVIDQ